MENVINGKGPAHRAAFSGRPVPFASLRSVRRGTLLIRAGAPASMVYFVKSGYLRSYDVSRSGQEAITAVLGPGQIAGIEALLAVDTSEGHRRDYRAYVDTLTSAEVWCAPAERVRDALVHDRALIDAVLTALGRRLALAEGLLRGVGLLPMAKRLPHALRLLETSLGGVCPSLSREDCARLLGVRRETVSRAARKRPNDRQATAA